MFHQKKQEKKQDTALSVTSPSVNRFSKFFQCHRKLFTRQTFTVFSVHVTYGRGSVLLWRRCDMSCTSGFVDDVIFAHNGQEATRKGFAQTNSPCGSTGSGAEYNAYDLSVNTPS